MIEMEKLVRKSIEDLKAAVLLGDAHLCVQAMDLLEGNPEFSWDEMDSDLYDEWDNISNDAVDIINEENNG